MTDLFQLVILIEGQGWRIVALFQTIEVCRAVEELVRWGWYVRAECRALTGA